MIVIVITAGVVCGSQQLAVRVNQSPVCAPSLPVQTIDAHRDCRHTHTEQTTAAAAATTTTTTTTTATLLTQSRLYSAGNVQANSASGSAIEECTSTMTKQLAAYPMYAPSQKTLTSQFFLTQKPGFSLRSFVPRVRDEYTSTLTT